MATLWSVMLLLFLHFARSSIWVVGFTDPETTAALRALQAGWKKSVPGWKGHDPCGSAWEGVICTDSKVTSLSLNTMNLEGTLASDIGSLTDLRSLDLSYNKGLTGTIPDTIGKLIHLDTLILIGCSFTGSIPKELGNLNNLTFLALNANKLSGAIPAELGNLQQLYWFDIADNQLSGPLPVSTRTSPGLDMLLKAKHFHFSKNRLSGPIPSQIFNSNMQLIHILFDSNDLTGEIPDTLGLVSTLEALRLDRNSLTGPIPMLANLTKLREFHLSNNQLTGTIPNFSSMVKLSYLDTSNNSFHRSEVPDWIAKMDSLTALFMEKTSLQGSIPPEIFSLPSLQTVDFKGNHINGSFLMGTNVASTLQFVDLENNDIMAASSGTQYKGNLLLIGNPVCEGTVLSNTRVCQPSASVMTYSTPTQCSMNICRGEGVKTNPKTCECQVPYSGNMMFRAPSFSDLSVSSSSRFRELEMSLWVNLSLPEGYVYICCLKFDKYNYLIAQVQLFPPKGKYFSREQIRKLGFALSRQTYRSPRAFGAFFFIPDNLNFVGEGKSGLNSSVVIGVATGAAALVIIVLAVSFYAVRQKRKAEKALELSKPFMSWGTGTSGADSGGAPKLKGARWFSLQELKNATNNFSEVNEIGCGGYGKVYKGILPGEGEMVAIKRAKPGSVQGGAEFKTEIELLSRVHHRNLVGLIGFCFEQGEQMLVYEYMSNGSLRDSLSGKTAIHLDWKRRVRVALGSAKGLTYLHELANPPIIHRDVKSANILLDDNLTAKVADFGLSKLVSEDVADDNDKPKTNISTQVKGTMGYLDPEYYMTHQLSEKSDVYSFGVVLLEMLSGKQPLERGRYIVREIKAALESCHGLAGVAPLVDPFLLPFCSGDSDTVLPGLPHYLTLALACVDDCAAARPRMSHVVAELESILAAIESAATDGIGGGAGAGAGAGTRTHARRNNSGHSEEFSSSSFASGSGFFSQSHNPINPNPYAASAIRRPPEPSSGTNNDNGDLSKEQKDEPNQMKQDEAFSYSGAFPVPADKIQPK